MSPRAEMDGDVPGKEDRRRRRQPKIGQESDDKAGAHGDSSPTQDIGFEKESSEPLITPYNLILFMSSIVLGWLAVYALVRPSVTGSRACALLLAAMTLYSFGYGMELACRALPSKLLWIRVEYAGIAFIPALWLIFVLQYLGRHRWLSPEKIGFLFIIPCLTLLFNYTNDFHNFYYAATELDDSGPVPMLAIDAGPWYWVHAAYINISVIAGTVLLLRQRLQSPRLYRHQRNILAAAAVPPLVAYGVYLLGFQPVVPHLDLTPYAFTATGLLISWGLFRYHLLDLAPVARDFLMENLADAVMVMDMQNRLVDFNPAARELFGWPRPPLGVPLEEICRPWPELRQTIRSGQVVGAEVARNEGDSSEFYETSLTPLLNPRGTHIGRLMVVHDVTTRKNAEEALKQARDTAETANRELQSALSELKRLTVTDRLTGAFNRRKFDEIIAIEMEKSIRYGSPLCLILFDLDHFKQVNDTYGHRAGDRVLVEMTQMVAQDIRASDNLIRWGGEEFIITTPGIDLPQATRLAERLGRKVARHDFPPAGRVTISFGVAAMRREDTVDSLVKRADDALYRAKRKGRNRVEVEESL